MGRPTLERSNINCNKHRHHASIKQYCVNLISATEAELMVRINNKQTFTATVISNSAIQDICSVIRPHLLNKQITHPHDPHEYIAVCAEELEASIVGLPLIRYLLENKHQSTI